MLVGLLTPPLMFRLSSQRPALQSMPVKHYHTTALALCSVTAHQQNFQTAVKQRR